MIGRTISHYRILDRLGEGGMGEVYLAEDTRLGRRVALKVLPAHLASDPESLRRMHREARALAAVKHPNVVTIYSVDRVDDVSFITMEVIEGATLTERLRRGEVSLEQLVSLGTQLADGLHAAHEHDIIHRDLKPANVVVDDDGHLTILDLGVAMLNAGDREEGAVGALTKTGVVVGTLLYMSPEQIRAEALDARTDVFSLGVLLYEMASGRRPFDGRTTMAVAAALLEGEPTPLEDLREDLPADFCRIVHRCLHQERNERFQTAAAVADELRALSTRLGVGRSGAWPGVSEPLGRRRVATLAVAVLATSGLLWLGLTRSASDPPGIPLPSSIRSVAVLPLENLMGDDGQAYLVDGMHEALIANLSKIDSLQVISRTSVMRYRASDLPAPEIAGALDVDGLVIGAVLQAGDSVQVSAQLIHGATDVNLETVAHWGAADDVLSLVTDVAREIATEFRIALTPRQESLLRPPSTRPEAQEAYFLGRYALNQLTSRGRREALGHFERALQLDGGFALARAGVATVHFLDGFFGAAPLAEAAPRARTAALEALALDPDLADALTILGFLRLYVDWDWSGAAESLERALALSPNDASARHGYADYLTVLGRPEAAVEQVRLGKLSDPMSPIANMPVIAHLNMAGRFEEALDECRAFGERFPAHPTGYDCMGDAFWREGRYEAALDEYRVGWGPDSESFEALSRGYEAGGAEAAISGLARYHADRAQSGLGSPLSAANAFARSGEADAAFEWLERAYEQRIPQILHLHVSPAFEALRGDPRFADLLRRIDLPENRR